MTKRQLMSLAIKVTGIWFVVVRLADTVASAAMTMGYEAEGAPIPWWAHVVWVVWMTTMAVAGLAVVLMSDKIAKRVTPNGDEGVTWAELRVGSGSVVLLAMKCLGMFLLLDGVMMLAQGLFGGINYGMSREIYILIAAGFNLVLGSYLFFGGQGAAWWLEGRLLEGEAPTVGKESWERPMFVQAVRIVGVVWLTWRLPWIVTVLVLQWLPEPFSKAGGYGAAVRGVLYLAMSVYMIMGAPGMVGLVFREKRAGVA